MLRLFRRGAEFSIRLDGLGELMNSRVHGSEEALAVMACGRFANATGSRILIGGLGMGFTLRAALNSLGPDADVVVAELVPEVVEWNRGPLGESSGFPLRDARASIRIGDVAETLKAEPQAYDAILLDVDNGPEGLTRKQNDWLYATPGLRAALRALKPGGVLAVWSAHPDREFPKRLRAAGFRVEETRVRARREGKGAMHTVWLAYRS